MGFIPEQMHGNQITVRTLDLYQPFNNIRQRKTLIESIPQ